MADGNEKQMTVETLTHNSSSHTNFPGVAHDSEADNSIGAAIRLELGRRNQDLDPQLVWRGKQDWSDLVVCPPLIFVQEKINPKVIIDRLIAENSRFLGQPRQQLDLFSDINSPNSAESKIDFYRHSPTWTNRMILGDSLHVMASLAEREAMQGKIQCVYMDPPYGIKFSSNFQWSTGNRDVNDGRSDHITREPEQVKAFRDTWKDGIHSYLAYLRDRFSVARELLTDSGCIFVQIGEENVHLVRCLLDEVFDSKNFVSDIIFRKKTMPLGAKFMDCMIDHILLYAKDSERLKYRQLYWKQEIQGDFHWKWFESQTGTSQMSRDQVINHALLPIGARVFRAVSMKAPGYSADNDFSIVVAGRDFRPPKGGSWITGVAGMERLRAANRLFIEGNTLTFKLFFEDFPLAKLTSLWSDTVGAFGKVYVVQTNEEVIKRCVLITTDPGDLVLDPTCGSGTTAYVAEHFGRRWITIDTSRVALALARARLMGARYRYYLLADSPMGRQKVSEVAGIAPAEHPTRGDVRLGFVNERVPHITLKSVANNAEVDVIDKEWQPRVEAALDRLNAVLRGHPQLNALAKWEVPREAPSDWPQESLDPLADFWVAVNDRQVAIEVAIAANADFEVLFDRPFVDGKKIRVSGPFTVESLSPVRALGVIEDGSPSDPVPDPKRNFIAFVLESLRVAGVQQAHKEGRIAFVSLVSWPGALICAEGRYTDLDDSEKRAGVFVGPEFGTVSRADLIEAVREAGEARFDVLIACAFNYDAHASEIGKLGGLPVLKARINADLHMARDLKNTGKGNLFVVFGEPDIEIQQAACDQIRVKIRGVDVFDPATGEVRSDSASGIACWFIDTNYTGESFFVGHAYFLGTNDPYKALKTTLKADINEEAWAGLSRDTSTPFQKPATGRIAVKVINQFGDEVMRVLNV